VELPLGTGLIVSQESISRQQCQQLRQLGPAWLKYAGVLQALGLLRWMERALAFDTQGEAAKFLELWKELIT